MKLKALILDFDGVVIESNEVKTDAFRRLFARYPDHSEAMMAFHFANISLGRMDKIDELLRRLGAQGATELRSELAATYSQHVRTQINTVPLVHGAIGFLETASAELPLYLASVTPEAELADTLAARNLGHWFKGVYGCPPWNKPAAIRDVLAREGVAPEDCLLIGDSAGDQRAARVTGVTFIGRDSGLAFEHPEPRRFRDLAAIEAFLFHHVSP